MPSWMRFPLVATLLLSVGCGGGSGGASTPTVQAPSALTYFANPATYTKAFEEIRKAFASTPQAKRAGFEAGHFSFNVEKGRCPVCKGDGAVKVEMHFLADIFVPCEACRADFKEHLERHPFDAAKESAFAWSARLHNAVSVGIGKYAVPVAAEERDFGARHLPL